MEKIKQNTVQLDRATQINVNPPRIFTRNQASIRSNSSSPCSRRSLTAQSLGLRMLIVSLVLSMSVSMCQAASGGFYLDGIGYREQALQQSKGTRFEGEDPSGLDWVSFAGGTHIFIKGAGLTDNPQSNFVFLRSVELEQDFMAPPLTEDDAFNSHPILGSLAYRLPALDTLIGVPMNYLDKYYTMTFYLTVMSDDELGQETLACGNERLCRIIYHRAYSPVIYYIQPPVVYFESYTELWYDPRSVPDLIQDLENDEMQFVNAKVGPALLDFEFNVDYDDGSSKYYRNKARGQVGELPAGEMYNVSMLWEVGHSMVQKQEATHCSYDNQTCYQARSVPVIFSQSANAGYKTGGMNLTVQGYGFNGNIKAQLDGVDCEVTSFTDFSFSCHVAAKDTASDLNKTYVGSNGVRRHVYNNTGTNWINWGSLNSYQEQYQKLALQMETPYGGVDRAEQIFKGWFIPPATTRYKFYQTCDNYCRIYLSNATNTLENQTRITYSTSDSNYRDWWEAKHSQRFDMQSEWISLTEGEPYYIQAETFEWTGGDHFSVAVEIEQTNTSVVGHHHSMKEVQYLQFEAAQVFETTRITIENPDSGKYLLVFQKPDLKTVQGELVAADASASTLKNAIKEYYEDNGFGNINVNMTMYDSNGTVTTNATNATSHVYYVTLKTLINGMSVAGISVVKQSTQSKITVDLPTDVQLSAEPLNGKIRIKCVDHEGYESFSSDIHKNWWGWNPNWMNEQIHRGCDRIFDATEVHHVSKYAHRNNGGAIFIRFQGINVDPGQFEIVSSENEPLTGTNITFYSNTTVPYSNNLFYEPIPFEMLRTFEEKPQLIVTVNDIPTVCHNLTCDFTYTEPVGEITGYSYNHNTKLLVLEGNDLPNVTANISSINFAHTNCVLNESSLSNTSLECTLDENPTCGIHLPILTSTLGIIPNSNQLVAEHIECTVTSIFPSTSLNLLGGDNLTFTGTMLPKVLSTSEVSIKFNDALQTNCIPQISSTDQLVCLTEKFDTVASANANLGVDIIINNKTVVQTVSATSRNVVQSGSNLNPSSVNPVLKTKIEIQLDANFPYTLNRNDFSVNATSISNSTYIRYLNVIAVNDTAKTITVMFGGAESKYGPLKIWIRHAVTGLIESDGLTLDVNAYVDSYSPKVGSIYGGTLLTITGRNFGQEITDNPVQISTNGGVDSIDCYVQSTSATEIKCRVDSKIVPRDNNLAGAVVVFLKTSEEATCDSAVCSWYYTASLPVVENVTTEFDNSTLAWKVKVTGTGFTGATSDVEFYYANTLQTTSSVTATEAVITISNVTSQTMTGSNLYFAVGLPQNFSLVQQQLDITPRLASISPSSGSIGGTLITATVPGATLTSTGLDIVNANTSSSICQSGTIRVVDYGVVECLTKLITIDAGTNLTVTQSGNSYPCVNSDITQCQYQQLSTSNYPTVTAYSVSANTIEFTGTAFDFSSDYTPSAEFSGIAADSVTVNSATSTTATFTLGVPFASNVAPALSFKKTGSSEKVFAIVDRATSLTNALSVSSSTTGLTCSFAGGCEYEVTAPGLSNVLKNSPKTNYISVCDEICEFNETASTAASAKCKLPPVSTIYSNENFFIATETEDLDSGVYFGTATDLATAFDGVMTNTPTDSSSECSLGMQFKENHVGMISQVKYFMRDMSTSQKAQLVDITQFQGSNDNTTFTTLFTVDKNLHSGWNYHKWETANTYPKYRYYRFYGASQGACAINEITFTGVETIDNTDTSYTCPAKVVIDGNDTSLETVQYQGALTTTLTAVSPRFGTVVGGTPVTFTGTNFPTDTSKYTIIIDGIVCPVDSATTTSVSCTTGSRPGLVETSLEIYIDGQGLVSNNGIVYKYVSTWSSDTTWGGEFAPMDGESIYIPAGLNLLVDCQYCPHINALIVEGSLIFAPDSDPNHERFFDANYIFVNGGLMEVGTEEFPYTSKITITMHGLISDPYLPIYGNKVIGVRYGTLDMHGIERNITWSSLENTVEAGGSVITLQHAVDWQPGEMIAIASTSYEPREGEHRLIKSIDASRKVITLDQPLDYKHFAMTQCYDGQNECITMRAEVGLLTRNVVYRGDPETSPANQYGATIFLHSNGDDSLTCRLSYIELTNVGQAFKIGRYAVHFHMIGAVHNSYAKGLGTHQGNNRAFTLHGTHYLRLEKNVAYEVKGHTVFIEDAVETNNYVKDNLIIKTKRSWSLLNTDQTPACFWITHPNNIFIGNAAAGSDRYGFWYDLQTHAIGPSANQDVCPENDRVGEFRDNSAHSMGRYGLRIFHNMVPRTYPCQPLDFDHTNPQDPYWQNPPITANFNNFTGWKNNRNGAIAERVGDVRFNDFYTADNILAGIEFSLTGEMIGEYAQINGALIIGKTNNTDWKLDAMSPHGIITSRKENFVIKNVRFYNFNWNNAAGLGTCSHCFHDAATDEGARTITTSGFYFDDPTVPRRIRYQTPFKAIFKDLDGTLTGLGPNTWATFYYRSHLWDNECFHEADKYDGVICNSNVQLRTIKFSTYLPSGMFDGMGLKVLQYDDSIISPMNETEKQAYIDDRSNYGSFNWKFKPSKNWAQPFVTGHKYKISWGVVGLDFEQMNFEVAQPYHPDDKSVYLIHNFTDVREGIEVHDRATNIRYMNETIAANQNDWVAGQNWVYNDTETREFHMVMNAKNKTFPEQIQKFKVTGIRCYGGCSKEIVEVEVIEDRIRYWSSPDSWPNGTVPVAGEDVHVESGWNMVYDLNDTEAPIYNNVEINGKLIFKNESSPHFKVKHLFVRAGHLEIGNETHPFNGSARITMHGEKNFEAMAFDSAIEGGNKIIANVGLIKMYGQPRTGKLTRLHAEVAKGSTEIFVEAGLDWVAGDRIALAPTSFTHDRSEDNFVTAYDSQSGKVTLQTPLKYHHWGAPVSTADNYNGVDMRGEVLLLTRSIVIAGEDIESWGGQIVTSDVMEFVNGEIKNRAGQTFLDHVEIYNCSQWDTYKAAIRFEKAVTAHSSITNCAVHNGLGWGLNIKNSANVHMKDNVFYDFRPVGIAVDFSRNITLDGNVLLRVLERTSIEADGMFEDKRGGFAICSYFSSSHSCSDLKIMNNIAVGVTFAGFITPGDSCGAQNSRVFYNNVAHSNAGTLGGYGALIYPSLGQSDHARCYEGSHFAAYKNYYMGAWGFFASQEVRFHHMTMIDNREGFGASLEVKDQKQYEGSTIMLNDNHIYGETEVTDCPPDESYCKIVDKSGFMMSGVSEGGKSLMPQMSSALPMYKIKSIGSWGGMQRNYRNKFHNFYSKTAQGAHQRLLALNPYQSDYHPMVEFYDTEFHNVDGDALAWLMPPPAGWANIKDCGEFPCTAPLNVLFTFEDTTFTGSKPSWASKDFQIIANNSGFAPYIDTCEPSSPMNAYVCKADKLGVLLFESEDEDKLDRSLQPIYVAKQGTGMNNKLNSMMDHVWDGFYSGQIRMSRFGSVFEGSRRSVYDLTFTGSPAKKMRFLLNGLSRTMGATIRIAYPGAESRSIVKDGKIVQPNQWNDDTQQYGEVKQSYCGENRYIGVQNILEFYITANCTLHIQPRDAIQTLVRMEWTMNEFFDNGGTTKFVDRLTASLGIHASQVKIVSVYEGSLVVNYEVEPEEGQTLEQLEQTQNDAFASGAVDLGAPILEFTAKVARADTSSNSASDYQPVTIVNGEYVQTNIGQGNTFDPNLSIQIEEQVSYNNVTVSIEREQTTQTQTVVIESDPEVIKLDKEKDPFVLIVPVALSVVIIIIGAILCRYCMNKAQREQLEAANRAQRTKDFNHKVNPDAELKVNETELDDLRKGAYDTNSKMYGQLDRDSNVKSMHQANFEEYAVQYDPNNDFAIFGVGDQTRGGVQSLKEKMNLADDVDKENEDSSSEDDNSMSRKDSKMSTQVVTNLNQSSRGQSGASSQDTAHKLMNNSSENNLPEDREIISEEEEEEEEE